MIRRKMTKRQWFSAVLLSVFSGVGTFNSEIDQNVFKGITSHFIPPPLYLFTILKKSRWHMAVFGGSRVQPQFFFSVLDKQIDKYL